MYEILYFNNIRRIINDNRFNTNKNSVAWVRERTLPTEWPLLVEEVSANFCWSRVSRGQRDWSPLPYFRPL
jgi:hypothetical protein